MIRKIVAVWVSLAMLFGFIVIVDVVIDFTPTVRATTLYVNETGSGGAYTSIQDAINASSDGDTVFVYNGTYYEHVVVNKSINLIGEDIYDTKINGGQIRDVINITTNWVNITGFNISFGGKEDNDAGIKLYNTQNCTITNNSFGQNHLCIYLWSSSNNIIQGNNVYGNIGFGNWNAIYLQFSSNNTIIGNKMSQSSSTGILLMFSNNNTLDDNNSSQNHYSGIYLDSSSNNDIIGNIVTNNGYCGISVRLSNNNTIINNNVSSTGLGSGITIGSSENITITGNNVSWNQYGISLYSSMNINITTNNLTNDGIFIGGDILENYNTHNIPQNNLINGKPLYYFKNLEGLKIDGIPTGQLILANCTDIEASNLNISDIEMGMEIAYSSKINLTKNNLWYNDRYGIYVILSSSNNISGNNINGNLLSIMGDYGIRLYSSSNNNISHNAISDNGWGIYLESSMSNTILGNNLFDNPYSLRFLESSNNRMKGNNISSSIYYGFYLESSTNNTVEGNQIMGNRWGISIHLSSHNSTVNSNYLFNNRNGISVYQSSNNTFARNDLINNEYGFNITQSSNNKVFHNNFINEIEQANDKTINENFWDNGYPSGGNFWSDYQGIDEFSGPNQDQPGNDGIGDTNYTIDSDSVDNYPLKYPIGNYTFHYEGWNLISIPFIQSNTNLGEILYPILGSVDAVQWYNSINQVDHWEHNHTSKPSHLTDLTEIDHKMGLWIYITEAEGVLFEYPGTQPTSNQTIQLYPGWNMVGYPSLTNYNRTKGLNNLTFGDQVDSIWSYDAATQKWEEMGDSDYFIISRGYYIHAKSDCEWEVPL